MHFPVDEIIFVHIQKTGGCSIKQALGEQNYQVDHHLALELRDRHGQRRWDSCFKFAVVRNPWERLVSWWSVIDASRAAYDRGAILEINPCFLTVSENHSNGEKTASLKNFFRYVVEHAKTFDEFLRNCDHEIPDPDGPKCIFRNQLEYVTDSTGTMMVDYVGRFEQLQQDFDFVCEKAGLQQRKLDVINASQHAHYSRYYTPYLVGLVADAYQRDIDHFGYSFDNDKERLASPSQQSQAHTPIGLNF